MSDLNPEMVIIAREVRALTQRALAEKSGISQPDLSRYENGLKPILEHVLHKLAIALGFPVSFFYQAGRREPRMWCYKNLRAMR